MHMLQIAKLELGSCEFGKNFVLIILSQKSFLSKNVNPENVGEKKICG